MNNTNIRFAGKLTLIQKLIVWAVKKPSGRFIHRLANIGKPKYSIGNAVMIGGIQFYSVTFQITSQCKIPVWGLPMIRVVKNQELYLVK